MANRREEYWRPIVDALEDGTGPACLLDYLLRCKYDPALLKRPPMTKAKADQLDTRPTLLTTWWFEVLCGEVTVTARPEGDLFGSEIEKGTVYASYISGTANATLGPGWLRRPILEAAAQAYRQRFGCWTRPSTPDGTRTRVVTFPDRETCQTLICQSRRMCMGGLLGVRDAKPASCPVCPPLLDRLSRALR